MRNTVAFSDQPIQRGRENWARAREQHEGVLHQAALRGVQPMPEKSQSGAVRRSLDRDALSGALKEANSKVGTVLDALDKADRREAQLAQAEGEGRRARSERFPEMGKGSRR